MERWRQTRHGNWEVVIGQLRLGAEMVHVPDGKNDFFDLFKPTVRKALNGDLLKAGEPIESLDEAKSVAARLALETLEQDQKNVEALMGWNKTAKIVTLARER